MKFSLKVSLSIVISAIVIGLSLSTFVNTKKLTQNNAEQNATTLFQAIAYNVKHEIENLISQSLRNAALLAQGIHFPQKSFQDYTLQDISPFLAVLEQNSAFYSAYLGRNDGSFIQLIATREHQGIIKQHHAPAETEWIFRKIYQNDAFQRVQHWEFLDKNLHLLEEKDDGSPAYDPRKRPWYQATSKDDNAVLSNVYVFNSLKKPGLTASQNSVQNNGVVGVDLRLSTLAAFLSKQRLSKNGVVVVIDEKGQSIALPDTMSDIPVMTELNTLKDERIQAIVNQMNGKTTLRTSFYSALEEVNTAGPLLYIGVAAPESDFMDNFETMQKRLLYITGIGLLIFLAITVVFSHRLSARASNLVANAKRIEDFNFDINTLSPSHILEFFELEQSFDQMRSSLQAKANDLAISQDKLNRLIELGIAMSAERDTDKVMEMVLSGAKELSNADGGTLYKIEDGALSFKIVMNTSLGISMGGTSSEAPSLPPVQLYRSDGRQNHRNVASHTVHESTSVNISDAYQNEQFDFSGTRKFDEMNHYKSQSFLCVPLKPRGGDVIGALQIINAQDSDGKIIPFSDEIQRFVEALAAQAATILYNRELLDAQEQLMDSFIQLIAGAIDAKSPYTGGHCERVPELATMLAQQANERNDGIFADFSFQTEEQWREFKIGAWLHDCGKVVTPEYVVDKATKLETIYNRIHEVRTRFEVLLRDAEIDYYKQLGNGGDQTVLMQKLEERKARIMDDFAFVAECNVGGEFMADDKIERLKQIAEQTWTRNFDITMGLSHQELPLYEGVGAAPTQQKLLEDQPYHILPRQRDITELYGHLNFKTPVPENLYNRGEIHNLSVSRGTLTEEERFKINEHIMQTIAMLESMPFPPHLQRVPEYAGTHHETMIGSGYPRQLSATDLSIPSRIMAIADIFEALTASDRPYKKAKTLSEAIKILSFFKKDEHIDPDLFDLFLTSGVYRHYAKKFLLPEQIDEVDITQYLS